MTSGNTSGNPADIERAMLTQKGMAQFEQMHAPSVVELDMDGTKQIACDTCNTDWPCERMVGMLVVQGLAMFQAMMPSGNMGAILSRFAGGGR